MKVSTAILNAALPVALAASLSAPAHADLSALWRFDSTGTSQPDSTLNANTATTMNGSLWDFDATRGSGVMTFDGLDDFLQAADSPSLSITGDITIALWVNLTGAGGFGQWRGLLAKDAPGSGLPGPYQMWFNQNSPIPAFGRGNNSSQNFAFGTDPTPIGSWQHWAVSTDADTGLAQFYLNGVPVAMSDTDVFGPTADLDGPLLIGDRPGAQDMSFFGRMDDIAIFNETLTQAQIQTIMSGDFTAHGVPEPTSAALTALALTALATRRRRSKR